MRHPAISLALVALPCLLLCKGGLAESSERPAQSASSPKPTIKERCATLSAEIAKAPPKDGSIICIGSSHMAFWKTITEDLAPLSVHNHAIAGSKMTDAADYFADALAIPYKPRAILLYEGSNDLATGGSPETVLAAFKKLHSTIRSTLPNTRFYVLGLVPSPGKRFANFETFRQTNKLLKNECASQAGMVFIDTTSPLLAEDGTPKMECFIPGDIHMTQAGYDIWKKCVAPIIVPAESAREK